MPKLCSRLALAIIANLACLPAFGDVSVREANSRTEIFVTGEITSDTRDEIAQITRSVRGPAVVYFDTIGGDLLSGLELGRIIRRSGFATDVGRATGSSGVAPGKCHSVCTMSYAGGYFRYLQPGSQLGVHRFYRNGRTGASDLDVGQVMSAAITGYLTEMGIDLGLFEVMVKAGRGQMIMLSSDQIVRFRMANFGFQPPSWGIEGAKGIVYLKGEQESFNGLGKVLMTCAKGGQVKFSALFNAGARNSAIIASNKGNSLRTNDRFLPVNQLSQAPVISGDFILASFIPDQNLIFEIRSATHVGFAFHGDQASTFHGFLVDKRGNEDMVSSFIQHCQGVGR